MKTTNYLTVNDIENSGKSGIDCRTESAFASLQRAVIYDDQYGGSKKFFEICQTLFKLPPTIKSITIYDDEDHGVWMSAENLAKMFPNLEKLLFYDIDSHFEYIKHLNSGHSKLKNIPQFRLATTQDAPLVVANSHGSYSLDTIVNLRIVVVMCLVDFGHFQNLEQLWSWLEIELIKITKDTLSSMLNSLKKGSFAIELIVSDQK